MTIIGAPRNTHLSCVNPLYELTQKFWDIELRKCPENPCSQRKIFSAKTYSFRRTLLIPLVDLSCVLPFKHFDSLQSLNLGELKNNAVQLLFSIERKFKRDDRLKHKYHAFLREFEELGHM